MLRILFGLLVALSAALPASAATDWSKIAARQPDGTFVQGNPAAPVKLVEYLSLTCPHCAKFEGEAIAPFTAKYVKAGLVSYEVRHALRDAFDFSASLLARCDGPEAFFTVTPVIYAQQTSWYARAVKWSETAPDTKDMPPEKMLPLVAAGAGLDQLVQARGLAPAKAATCLADANEQKLLVAMASEAWHRPNFPGTPTFLINGVTQDDLGTWAELDRRLGAALQKTRHTP